MGTVGVLAVSGCGGGDDDAAPSTPQLLLRPGFAAGDRFPAATVAGIPQRLPFVVSDLSSGQVAPFTDGAPTTIDIEITSPGGAVLTTVTAPLRSQGIITPYYPVEIVAETTGRHQARTTVDGLPLSAGFDVVDAADVGLVQVGESIRPVETPTFADPAGVEPICTRPEACPFHEVTLTDAIAAAGPTALLVATPGFCLTDICGPVVDLLVDVSADFAEFTFVHCEVYTDPQRLFEDGVETEDLLTQVMRIYDLRFEPSLVVADATGMVTARLDFTFDTTDLATALATAL